MDLLHLLPDGWSGPLSALFQVLVIDLLLAGDNAVAVGLAAAGLPVQRRRQVIMLGLIAAVALRIGFALVATQLLAIVGLLLAGGALLLWVCWKMWRELRAAGHHDPAAEAGNLAAMQPAKSFRDAFLQILAADVSMSLDNVLAVAGAAHEHPAVLEFGLLLSIALMGLAASWIARMLNKRRWIGYIGLFIVLYVALHMMWQGARTVAIDLNRTAEYNAAMPGSALDIGPAEVAGRLKHKP